MGSEIERKYLVRGDEWRKLGSGVSYRQGYLSTVKERTVRVRTVDDRAYLTIKGVTVGATRREFEYDIPAADAAGLFELCEQPLIEKVRYRIPFGGVTWEVDEFEGANQGLIVAERELAFEDQQIELPAWIGVEVTGDPRYFNSNLIAHPFSTW
jgi:CYTH domain-containing protein